MSQIVSSGVGGDQSRRVKIGLSQNFLRQYLVAAVYLSALCGVLLPSTGLQVISVNDVSIDYLSTDT